MIATDLKMIPQREAIPLGRTETPWDPLFFPKDYCKSQPNEDIEECCLTEKQLMNLGKEVTKFRQKFELLAEKLLEKEMEAE